MCRRAVLLGLSIGLMLLAADSGAGLKWNAPTSWKAQGNRPMRLNTYIIQPSAGDTGTAECGVFYFGNGQGGSVQANLDRWIGQFQQPGGGSSKQAAKINTGTVHGLKVTTVDVSGAYSGMGGPMGGSGPALPGYRLLGAIAEGPEGTVFFKFTGPAKTIAANAAAFTNLVQSISKE